MLLNCHLYIIFFQGNVTVNKIKNYRLINSTILLVILFIAKFDFNLLAQLFDLISTYLNVKKDRLISKYSY